MTDDLDEDYGSLRMEVAQRQAAERGLVVTKPAVNELFIDIDNEESYAVFNANIGRVAACLPCEAEEWDSPSGRPGHRHILVTFAPSVVLTDIERIALQAVLGSDRVREVLSWQRAFKGVRCPTLFFEKPT